MLDFELEESVVNLDFFQKLASYGNNAWKGNYTQEEVNANAEDYLYEWEYSLLKGSPSIVIRYLFEILAEDDSEQAKYFLKEMEESLSILNI